MLTICITSLLNTAFKQQHNDKDNINNTIIADSEPPASTKGFAM